MPSWENDMMQGASALPDKVYTVLSSSDGDDFPPTVVVFSSKDAAARRVADDVSGLASAIGLPLDVAEEKIVRAVRSRGRYSIFVQGARYYWHLEEKPILT